MKIVVVVISLSLGLYVCVHIRLYGICLKMCLFVYKNSYDMVCIMYLCQSSLQVCDTCLLLKIS